MKKIKVLGLLMMLAAVSMVGCGKEPEYVPGGGFTDAVYDEVVEEIEEVDPFAIPEVIEGKVPTRNEAYIALEDAGCGSDDNHHLELYLNDSDEDGKFVEYYNLFVTDNKEYLFSRYFKMETAEDSKYRMNKRYGYHVEDASTEPDISEETHYCFEEIEHVMKGSCEVFTFKKTLHDNRCNVITDHEYEPTYIIEQDICKGDGYLMLAYAADENGNPIYPNAQKVIQIYKDLEFITFE